MGRHGIPAHAGRYMDQGDCQVGPARQHASTGQRVSRATGAALELAQRLRPAVSGTGDAPT
eukprot:1056613-Alexandrium_andersonii.AAC.1